MTVALDIRPSTANRVEKGRSVKYEWRVGTIPAGDGYADRDVLAVLTISHSKAGYNAFSGEITTQDYFSVILGNETVEQRESGFAARGFLLFSGLGIARLPAGNRFSAKKLREAAETGYALFKDEYEDGNPKVLRYFDMDTRA